MFKLSIKQLGIMFLIFSFILSTCLFLGFEFIKLLPEFIQFFLNFTSLSSSNFFDLNSLRSATCFSTTDNFFSNAFVCSVVSFLLDFNATERLFLSFFNNSISDFRFLTSIHLLSNSVFLLFFSIFSFFCLDSLSFSLISVSLRRSLSAWSLTYRL